MASIGRRDLVLMLIGVDPNDGLDDSLGGMTRLMKYIFLLEREVGLTPSGSSFEFIPYKAGPASKKLYDDLEFLENLGFIEARVTATATDEEAAEVEMLSFDELMGDDSEDSETGPADGGAARDAFEERQFTLSEKGLKRVAELLADPNYKPVTDGIRRIKNKYANHSLHDLLHHIYTKYPEMAVASEIKDKILRRGRN